MTLLHVCLGGAIGAGLRWLVAGAVTRALGQGFPFGTLLVNVSGGFAMGIAAALLVERGAGRLSPFLMTGILGGYTTFSAFSLETVGLIEAGRAGAALAYAGLSVALSVGALALGLTLGRSLA